MGSHCSCFSDLGKFSPFSSFQKPLSPFLHPLWLFSKPSLHRGKTGTRAISPQTNRLPLYSTNTEEQMWPRLLPTMLSGISIYIEFNYAIKVIFLSWTNIYSIFCWKWLCLEKGSAVGLAGLVCEYSHIYRPCYQGATWWWAGGRQAGPQEQICQWKMWQVSARPVCSGPYHGVTVGQWHLLFLHGSPESQLCSIKETSGLGQREHRAWQQLCDNQNHSHAALCCDPGRWYLTKTHVEHLPGVPLCSASHARKCKAKFPKCRKTHFVNFTPSEPCLLIKPPVFPLEETGSHCTAMKPEDLRFSQGLLLLLQSLQFSSEF